MTRSRPASRARWSSTSSRGRASKTTRRCSNVTPNHLSLAVAQSLGRGARAVIADRHALEARKLLRYSDLSIAYPGFAEPTHFARLFKREAAITPLAYRQNAEVRPEKVISLGMKRVTAPGHPSPMLAAIRDAEAGRRMTMNGEFTTTGRGAVSAYGSSKAALNALTAKFAAELAGSGILVNAVCPGLTATAPGMEAMGAQPIPEGAASVVWAATLPDDGPSGGFFRDGKPLPW